MPNALDLGTGDAGADLGERLPLGTLRVAARPRPLGLREREDDARLPEARRRRLPARAAAAADRDRRAAAAAQGPAGHRDVRRRAAARARRSPAATSA